ncbi:MAG: prepilin-type N-terminal cleavage/methylation domain-containing protein [Planctomycetales bacterium]|nr:prepilin-type N-terminal cleavage/methylation domain-containing protein [Planctomycetales bacterium]
MARLADNRGSSARATRNGRRRRAFTLVEMLVVIAMLVTLASMSLFALWGANESAKADRTRAIIEKVDLLVMQHWNRYSTRRIAVGPILGPSPNPRLRAMARLAAVRELQRMELPERVTDLRDGVTVLAAPPAKWLAYRRRLIRQIGETAPGSGIPNFANWSASNQGSECLYLILSSLSDGDKNGLDTLKPEEIGDLDNDNMPEVLDAWKKPIDFLRWPAGYISNPEDAWYPMTPPNDCSGRPVVVAVTEQTAPHYERTSSPPPSVIIPAPSPDPFDPLRVDPRWTDVSDPTAGTSSDPQLSRINDPFSLRPLIYSAGPDRIYAVDVTVLDSSGNDLIAHATPSADMAVAAPLSHNDPYRYYAISCSSGTIKIQLGTPRGPESLDNITNHYMEAK